MRGFLGLGIREKWITSNKFEVAFLDDKNVLKLTEMMAVQLD